ncbi:MAG TPA: Hsp70 family protein, partial [Bryobacteraceae bacterium]|nr:Hsp70 family protein [Bryobacteraceae bacterium]
MGRIVGIDLGTTNSLVAYADAQNGQPKFIPGPYGSTLCPSVVSIDADGGIVVGEPAKRRLLTQPERTIYSVKRLMGRGPADVQNELKLFPFRIDPTSKNVIRVRLGEKVFTPPEISAFILRELRNWAEAFFGDAVDRAVITVPAYFDDAQRQATKDAGKIAGLEVLRLVNEPTAAALAYGLHEKQRGRVAVYDLGGGTFDISVLKLISTREGEIYQVLSTNGDTHLGGDDIDNLLQAFVHEQILQHDRVDFSPQAELAQELRRVLINVKHQLSEAETATLRFPLPNGKVFTHEFTRGAFEALIRPVVDRTMAPVKKALADAQLKPSDMDEVVLVGGATRTPMIRRRLVEVFGHEPRGEVDADLCVALGAAIEGAAIAGAEVSAVLVDVTPYTFGTSALAEFEGEIYPYRYVPIIPRNTPIPVRKSEVFYTVADNQTRVDVRIYQGENADALQNIRIGEFRIEGLSKAPAGNEVVLDLA